MDNAEYIQDVALRCYKLSAQCFHLETSRDLRILGDELIARSAEIKHCQSGNEPMHRRALWWSAVKQGARRLINPKQFLFGP
jgi:hypothetical protein